MKIGIIADPIDNQRAGVHYYTKHLLAALLKHRNVHNLLIVREKKTGIGQVGIEEIAIRNFRWGLGIAALRLFLIVPLVFRLRRADLVIEPAHFGPFYLPKSIKRVTIIHDMTPWKFPQWHRWHSQMLQKVFLRRILKKADLIIVNSMSTHRDVAGIFPRFGGKIVSIYPGVSSEFRPIVQKELTDPFTFGLPYWLTVSTIEPRKGHLDILKAYEQFRASTSERVLWVVCGAYGWKADGFMDRLKRSPYQNDIILTGYVENSVLRALYSGAIGLIYMSYYEGFGFPVLEAMACGCPVLCSDNSSLPEVGGDLAFYASAGNIGQILDHMNKIWTMPFDERQVLKDKFIGHVEKFNWDQFGIQLIEHLEACEKRSFKENVGADSI